MSAPCCPGHEGGRGPAYTPHWFIIHGEDGAIDITATWDTGGLPSTDLEFCTTVSGMFTDRRCPLVYGEQTRRWYLWDGSGRYAVQKTTFGTETSVRVASYLKFAFEDVWDAVDEWMTAHNLNETQRGKVMRHWQAHRSFSGRMWSDTGQRAMRSVLSSVCARDMEEFDRETGKIIVDNGVLDIASILSSGQAVLFPHDHRMLVTRRMGEGVRWEPDAQCPAFELFMKQSVPDDEQRWWLLWRVAHTLFGSKPRKGFVNLIGERDSGKSTFTELIAHLAGDYAKTVQAETFLSKHSGDQGFRQHELMGARFVHTHEPTPGGKYDVALMKTITGNDKQTTRTLNQGFITWVPQCTPFIGSNNPIRFFTSDDAMMNRQEVIRFERHYDQLDQWLGDRLRAEAPGILALLIRHLEQQHRAGRVPELPLSMVTEREKLAEQTEDALEFVAEWIIAGRLREDSSVPVYRCAQVNPLYQQYQYWCEEAGVKPIGRKSFANVLDRRYPKSRPGGTWHFAGLVSA